LSFFNNLIRGLICIGFITIAYDILIGGTYSFPHYMVIVLCVMVWSLIEFRTREPKEELKE
jgi:hypothetical protein